MSKAVAESGGDATVARLATAALGAPLLGQARAAQLLGKALSRGSAPPAWIFHGPAGVGKCTCALRMAALLVDPETAPGDIAAFTPRTGTRSAELLVGGSHPDIHLVRKELAGASADRALRERKQTNLPVGVLRERMLGGVDSEGRILDGAISRTAYLGRAKAFIVDEAELLDAEGQNALLKTLEEPPPDTFIVLVTTHEDRLLPTIRSRCQRVAFAPLAPEEMARWAAENIADGEQREWVLDFAAGSPGRAQLAASRGLFAWHGLVEEGLDSIEAGREPALLHERLAEAIDEFAEAETKAFEQASKESAKGMAFGLLVAVAGQSVGRRMEAALRRGDTASAEGWMEATDLLLEAERGVASNVAPKFVLADLFARISRARATCARMGAATPTR